MTRAYRVIVGFLRVLTWIFFRAGSLADAWLILNRIGTFAWSDPRFPAVALALILAVWLYQVLYESRLRGLLELAPVRVGLVVAMIVCIAIFSPSGVHPFIYFQF